MLIELNKEFAKRLPDELEALSDREKKYFHPHGFDLDTVSSLSKEKGNHYYIYIDGLGKFAGYGMLRTFGKYEIPTLGCAIWRKYRGRGNGDKLVKELIEEARALQYHKIRLKVFPDNEIAYRLYKRIGFKKMDKIEYGQVWMEYKL